MRLPTIALVLLCSGCASIQSSLYTMGVASERSQSGLEHRTVEINGTSIHYLERPGRSPGAETLVLIHGFAGNKDHWIRFARFLPPCYRVLALDLPGHGDNARDTTAIYSISNLTGVVSAFVSELAPGQAHVVGNSLGGRIAAELALSDPHRARTISLLDPAGVPSPEPSELDAALARGVNLLIPTTREEYERLLSISFGDEAPNFPWPVASVVSRQYTTRAAFYRRMWADLGSEPNDLEFRLSELRTPLLVIWGDEDGVLDVSAAHRWEELVAGALIEVMAGVGHAPMLERPEETAELVHAFIEQAP